MFRNSEGVGPPPRAAMFRNSERVGWTPPRAVMFRNSEGVDTAVQGCTLTLPRFLFSDQKQIEKFTGTDFSSKLG